MGLFDGTGFDLNPTTLTLASLAQAAAQSAGPSRMPISTGAVWGNLAGGLVNAANTTANLDEKKATTALTRAKIPHLQAQLEGMQLMYPMLKDELSKIMGGGGSTAAGPQMQERLSPSNALATSGPAFGSLSAGGALGGAASVSAPDEYKPLIQEAASKNNIPPDMFTRLLHTESSFNPNAKSPAGALGIAQFMPGTAARFGIDPMDANQAIPASAKYIGQNRDMFGGNLGLAVAGYNWGEGNVQKWLQSGADPSKVPNETQNYVTKVTGQPLGAWLKSGAAPQPQPPQQAPQRPIQLAQNGPPAPGMMGGGAPTPMSGPPPPPQAGPMSGPPAAPPPAPLAPPQRMAPPMSGPPPQAAPMPAPLAPPMSAGQPGPPQAPSPQAGPMPGALAPPQAAAAPSAGVDPRRLAVLGTMGQMFGLGDITKPLDNYYYQSPEHKQALERALIAPHLEEHEGKAGIDQRHAEPTAFAKGSGEARAAYLRPENQPAIVQALQAAKTQGEKEAIVRSMGLQPGSPEANEVLLRANPGSEPTPDSKNFEYAQKTPGFEKYQLQQKHASAPPNIGTIPEGMQLVPTPEGGYRMDPVPGGKVDMAQKNAAISTQKAGAIVTQDIDRALPMVGAWTAGPIGTLTKGVPGSQSHDLDQLLLGIGANTSLDRLQEMRSASPTGGALGNVTEGEHKILRAVYGSLEQSQTPDQLKYNLMRLRNVYVDTVNGSPERLETLVRDGKLTPEQASAALSKRMEGVSPGGATAPGAAPASPQQLIYDPQTKTLKPVQ